MIGSLENYSTTTFLTFGFSSVLVVLPFDVVGVGVVFVFTGVAVDFTFVSDDFGAVCFVSVCFGAVPLASTFGAGGLGTSPILVSE